MIKKENFVSSVGQDTSSGFVDAMIQQHNKDGEAHKDLFQNAHSALTSHKGDAEVHVTQEERKTWDKAANDLGSISSKMEASLLNAEAFANSAYNDNLSAETAAYHAEEAQHEAAFSRDRAEKYAARSQEFAGLAQNAQNAADSAYQNTVNMATQMTKQQTELKDALDTLEDAYDEVLEGLGKTVDVVTFQEMLLNKADKETQSGGFKAGNGAETTSGGAIGKNAKSTAYGTEGAGGAAGDSAQGLNGGGAVGFNSVASYGGAVGNTAKAQNGGGAVGSQASALSGGGAVGKQAKAGAGFSGGSSARVSAKNGAFIDAIQLGEGTNSVEKSLQVYSYQLLDGNGKIPKARLPELGADFEGFAFCGEVNSFSDLPADLAEGDVYRIKNGGVIRSDACSPLFTKNFSDCFYIGYTEEGIDYYEINALEEFSDYLENTSPDGTGNYGYANIYAENGRFVASVPYGQAVGAALGDFVTSGQVSFYICPDSAVFCVRPGDMIVRSGERWYSISNSYGAFRFCGEVNTFSALPSGAADGDVYRLKTGCMFSNDPHSGLISGGFSTLFEDVFGDGEYYNAYSLYTNADYIEYFVQDENSSYMITHIYNQNGTYIGSMVGNGASGWPKSMFAPLMTGDSTVSFYLSSVKTTFYTVSDMGLVYRYNGKWYPVSDAGWIKRELGDIEAALDGILSIQAELTGGESE